MGWRGMEWDEIRRDEICWDEKTLDKMRQN